MKYLVALAALGALSSCNTVEGIGADLTAGGQAIEQAAESSRQPAPYYAPPPVGSRNFEPGPSRDVETGELATTPNAARRVYQPTQTYQSVPAYSTPPSYEYQPVQPAPYEPLPSTTYY